MFAKQVPVQRLLGSKKMNVCDRADTQNGPRSSPGPLSWYFAQRALPELKYVLTSNGYTVLP
jgi:hypothetical protein